jgi:xanthine dehydrogenase accessory factor
MKEIRDIVAAYDRALHEGQAAALATVISVEGSSYRQAGARMLITEDGCMTGAISGGCLEGDALKKARLVMERGLPKLVRYDTNDEDDAQVGLGLGCKGIIEVLIEPLDRNAQNAIDLLRNTCAARELQVIVTHATRRAGEASIGTCLLLSNDSETITTSAAARFQAQAKQRLKDERTSLVRTDDEVLFCELLQPELRILICGAGNDAIPLTQLAAVLGWETHVIDGRPSHATAARFPAADKLSVLRLDQTELLPQTDSRTVTVLMSHNYNYDVAMLRHLLGCETAYIGVLGPKRKLERMLDEIGLDPEQLPANLFGPTGLDIGASTPEEIALSIVAEIQSVIGKRAGTSLRERHQPIHAG